MNLTASRLLPTMASPALIAEAIIILLASESKTLLSDVSRIPFRVASASSFFKLARQKGQQPYGTVRITLSLTAVSSRTATPYTFTRALVMVTITITNYVMGYALSVVGYGAGAAARRVFARRPRRQNGACGLTRTIRAARHASVHLRIVSATFVSPFERRRSNGV